MLKLNHIQLARVRGSAVPNPCEASVLNANLISQGVPPVAPSGPGYPVGLCTSTAVSSQTGVINSLTGIGGQALPNFLSNPNAQNGLR